MAESATVAGLRRRLDPLVPRDAGMLRRALLWLFAAGLGLRVLLVLATDGSLPDLLAFRFVHQSLADDPLRFYSEVNPESGRFAWPYLTGYLPILETLIRFADATSLSFDRLVRLPAIAADLAIAWVVQWHMGWRGAKPQARLAGAALIVLAPVGIAFTGAHGQIDPLEWLPVVLAIVAWERLEGDRRTIVAGLLVGVGIAIKPPAALGALALFALARGIRERIVFALSAAVVPGLLFAPFLLADPEGALTVLDYQSIPGQGGLSLIIQPDLALARFAGTPFPAFSGLQDLLQDIAPLLVAAATILVALVGANKRSDPAALVAALTLVVFVVSPNFLPPYAIWLVPFAVLAGWWRFLLVIHVLTVFVLPFKYLPARLVDILHLGDAPLFSEGVVASVYIPASALLWAVMAWRLLRWVRSDAGAAPRYRSDP